MKARIPCTGATDHQHGERCNHCVGVAAVRKMPAVGLPVVRGGARHGSKTDLFPGAGDALELSA